MNIDNNIKVYCPLAGRYCLLRWWSYNERGNIILAKTEKALHQTVHAVFNKHDDMEIKEAFEIEFAAPSAKLVALVSDELIKDESHSFKYVVIGTIKEAIEEGLPIPKDLFEVCETYEREPEPEGYIADEDDEWVVKTHYGCVNCTQGIRCSLSDIDLYLGYYDKWQQLTEEPRKVIPTKQKGISVAPSAAPIASDDDELWAASCMYFGHHGEGATIDKIDLEEVSSNMYNNTLFFFKKIRDIDVSSLSDELRSEKETLVNLEEARIEAIKNENDNSRINFLKSAMGIFNAK